MKGALAGTQNELMQCETEKKWLLDQHFHVERASALDWPLGRTADLKFTLTKCSEENLSDKDEKTSEVDNSS